MFCNNCGKELENGAKFCNNCGAQQQISNTVEPQPAFQESTATPVSQPVESAQSTVPYAQPANNQQNSPQYSNSVPYNPNANLVPPVKAKKSSTGCIIGIIIAAVVGVIIIAGIIIVALISYNTVKGDTDETAIGITFETEAMEEDFDVDIDININDSPNPEYTEIFSSNNIVDSPTAFIGLDVRTFASVDDEGIIEKMEFAHDGDVIKELVDTIYYPVSDYSDTVVDSIDKAMKEAFSNADKLDCCTVEYKITDDYYITTIHSTELNNVANLASLSAEEVLTYDGFAAFLSMEQTANNLISQGYVEK